MLNVTEITINAFTERLKDAYTANFGRQKPDYPDIIAWVGRMSLERMADSDALYHDVEHTLMVTLAGQEILLGKHIREGGITPDDWLHFMVALLCHDIGYVRGVCIGDVAGAYVIDQVGNTFSPPQGASDASLTPYHVERGKIFVRERFSQLGMLDVDRVIAGLELTRFPVPDVGDARDTTGVAGLVRAADLIGQLGDPNYMRKINRLFHEFNETGANKKMGFNSPADLAAGYSNFFFDAVGPYIGEGLNYLRMTQHGKQWIANLYAHVFAAEHREPQLGPQRGEG
ncbi:MAG: metal-dependent phosphohydrolase [Proteobacteria bacterium]|nr:metal-dependent phosphohydrolase [Pseudomonadota bacterium]